MTHEDAQTFPSISLPSQPQPRRSLRDTLITINNHYSEFFPQAYQSPSIQELAQRICALEPTGITSDENGLAKLQIQLDETLRQTTPTTTVEQAIIKTCEEFRQTNPDGDNLLQEALAKAVGIPDPRELFTLEPFSPTPIISAYYQTLRAKEEQINPQTHDTLFAQEAQELQQPLTISLIKLTRAEFIARANILINSTLNIGRLLMGEDAANLLAFRFYTELKGPISAAIGYFVLQSYLQPDIEQYMPSVQMDQLGIDIAQLHVASDTLIGVTSAKSNKRRIPIFNFAAYHGTNHIDMSSHLSKLTNASGRHLGYKYFVPMLITSAPTNRPITLNGITYYYPVFSPEGKFTNPFRTRPKDLMPCPVKLTEDTHQNMSLANPTFKVHPDTATVIAIAINYGPFEEAQDELGIDYTQRSMNLIQFFYDFKEADSEKTPKIVN